MGEPLGLQQQELLISPHLETEQVVRVQVINCSRTLQNNYFSSKL
jgi:hypothetical protein